jgi:uncharacterized protein (DUF2236 family)
MSDFVDQRSIARTIWGNPDLVLLVFAGAAAEFALNRAVDWLFFTNSIPRDPFGRLFSTVNYAQQIVFADEAGAQQAFKRINAIHHSVESKRAQTIPDWAFRDVLYMLIDYSERAYQLLYGPLTVTERQELYDAFRRAGEGLQVTQLPTSYKEWRKDRVLHLKRDLVYSQHTRRLYQVYRRHLGLWRYQLLLEVQAVLVPEHVRRLLRLDPLGLLAPVAQVYGMLDILRLHNLVHLVLIPPQYWEDIRRFDRRQTASRRY